ncbi:MAG: large conductance mechanosensitive channel protein MscL [Saprospiraceae bacterium]|jgi:large conductance mechanosensitive channel
MLKEFKEFALKGNMLDMAIGIVIGAAFGTIINSLVADVLMPLLSMVSASADYSNLFILLKAPEGVDVALSSVEEIRKAGGVVLAYGLFINAVLSFLIVALALFFVVKAVNKLKKAEAPAPPAGPSQEELLAEIRDLLKK